MGPALNKGFTCTIAINKKGKLFPLQKKIITNFQEQITLKLYSLSGCPVDQREHNKLSGN